MNENSDEESNDSGSNDEREEIEEDTFLDHIREQLVCDDPFFYLEWDEYEEVNMDIPSTNSELLSDFPIMHFDFDLLEGEQLALQSDEYIQSWIIHYAARTLSPIIIIPHCLPDQSQDQELDDRWPKQGFLLKIVRHNYSLRRAPHEVIVVAKATERILVAEHYVTTYGVPFAKKIYDRSRFSLLPLHPLFLSSRMLSVTSDQRNRLLLETTGHIGRDAVAIQSQSNKSLIHALVPILKLWIQEDKVDEMSAKDIEIFSSWLNYNLSLDCRLKSVLANIPCIQRRLQFLSALQLENCFAHCAKCSNKIISCANVLHLPSLNSTSGIFKNPNHCSFDMAFYREVIQDSVIVTGSVNYNSSWFPRYGWQYVQCSRCHHHMGWKFTSHRFLPRHFYGISRSCIVMDREGLDDVVAHYVHSSDEVFPGKRQWRNTRNVIDFDINPGDV